MRVIIFIVLVLSLNIGVKKVMQNRITHNYRMREAQVLPDEWYWVDAVYLRLYGDYCFYQ